MDPSLRAGTTTGPWFSITMEVTLLARDAGARDRSARERVDLHQVVAGVIVRCPAAAGVNPVTSGEEIAAAEVELFLGWQTVRRGASGPAVAEMDDRTRARLTELLTGPSQQPNEN